MKPHKVLLSGVYGGIGKEIAKSLSLQNIKVIGMDLFPVDHDQFPLDDYYQIDLTSLELINEQLEKIYQDHKDIDLIINNAGIAHIKSFMDESEAEFNKVMDINFNSLVISTRFWINKFSQRLDGTIANMASMAGYISPSGMTSYSASKHAVVGFTESLRLECEAIEIPVKIILITPGFIDTDIMKIGEEGGPPDSFRKLTTTPEKAAQSIVKGLLRGDSLIIPDSGGKIMKQMNRWIPEVLNFGNGFISKKILKK
jgi:uncharacterized protein